MKNPNRQNRDQNLFAALRRDRLVQGLAAALLVAACGTAYLTFMAVRSLVASWTLPGGSEQPASAEQLSVAAAEMDTEAPLQPSGAPTPVPWDGVGRVTVLVLGMDYRDWELDQGPPRTDTMLLLTMDPVTRTAGILSIPRDLWVTIPGFENNKINTAYRLGVVYDAPGGGPGLTIRTVEGLLGVPINFYALVEFNAFVQVIDELGGLEVDVPYEMSVDPLGPGNTVTLPPGPNLLDGEVALAYARARDTIGGDFDRADRTQQVIMAVRERVLSLDMVTTLVSKAPLLYQQIAGGLETNLSIEQAIRLGLFASQIPEANITRRVIGPDHVDFSMSYDGLDILVPRMDQIRVVRDEIFAVDEARAPIEVDPDPTELVEAEAARVAVLNGTFTPGLAAQTTDFLKTLGINVTVTGNAVQSYNETTLIDYSGKPYTVQYLVDTLGISPNRIFSRYDSDTPVDVEVNLGSDWSLADATP